MPRVSLVPREEKGRELRRRAGLVPIAGGVILIAILGGSYFYYSTSVDNAQQDLSNARAKNAALSKQLAELQNYQQIKSQKDSKLSSVQAVYSQRVRWSRILDDLSFVIPSDIWLTSMQASIPGTPVTACSGTSKPSGDCTQIQPDVLIEGYTHENEMPVVATFLIRLGLMPSLANVNLISAQTEKVGNNLVIHFKIGVTLKNPAQIQENAPSPATGQQAPSPVVPNVRTTPTRTGAATGATTGTVPYPGTGTITGPAPTGAPGVSP